MLFRSNDKRYDKKARESVQATEATDEINKHQEQRKKGMALASKTKENDIDKLKSEHKVAINEDFFKEAAKPAELKTTEAEAASSENDEEAKAEPQAQAQAPQAA